VTGPSLRAAAIGAAAPLPWFARLCSMFDDVL
jgi:hypothetical protein